MMMKTIKIGVMALVACVLTSGCASMFARSDVGVDEFYIGAKTDSAILTESGHSDFSAYTQGLQLFALLDLPLSIVLDTVLLPVDLFLVPRKGK